MSLSRDIAKFVQGRRIVSVRLNRFADGRGGFTYDPVIDLDNGVSLSFVVQETETPDYGIDPLLTIPDRGADHG